MAQNDGALRPFIAKFEVRFPINPVFYQGPQVVHLTATIETGGHSYSTWLYAVKLHLSQGFVTVRGWEVLKFARCFLKTTFVF